MEDLLTTVILKTLECVNNFYNFKVHNLISSYRAFTIPTSNPGLEAVILWVTKMSKVFLAPNSLLLQAYLLRKVHNTLHKGPTNNLSLPQHRVLNSPTHHPLFLTIIHMLPILRVSTMAPLTILDMCPKGSSSILPCSSQVLKARDLPPTPPPNSLLVMLALVFSHRPPMVKGCINQEDMKIINPTLIIRNINISTAIASDFLRVLSVLATMRSSFMEAARRAGCKDSWG